MRYRRPGNMSTITKLTLGSADVSGAEGEREREPVIGGDLTLRGAPSRRRGAPPARPRPRPGRRTQGGEAGAPASKDVPDAARDYIAEHARPNTRRWEETARLLGLRPADLEPIRDGLGHRWRDRAIDAITGHDVYAAVDDALRHGLPGLPRRKGISEGRARRQPPPCRAFSAGSLSTAGSRQTPASGCTGRRRRRPANE